MRNLRQMRLDRVGELALHSLHMIDVVLQKKIGRADIANDVERLTGARQKETGNVECVDRLGQELDAGRAELIGSKPKIGDKCCAHGLDIDSLRRDAGQAVELHATERRCVFDRLCDAVLKFADATGIAGYTAFTGSPIARRQVVQYLCQAMTRQTLGNLILWISIRKQILHAREARFRRSVETVEKLELVVEHRKICSKLWHGGNLIATSYRRIAEMS